LRHSLFNNHAESFAAHGAFPKLGKLRCHGDRAHTVFAFMKKANLMRLHGYQLLNRKDVGRCDLSFFSHRHL